MKSTHLAKALIKMSEESKKDSLEKFIHFAKKKNLLPFLRRVLYYIKLEESRRSKKELFRITSSHALEESSIKNIKKIIGAPEDSKNLVEINQDLIGGFVGRYKNKTYNASISNQFKRLRNVLTK